MFNITTHEKAKEFLSSFLNIASEKIDDYILNNTKDYDVDNFLETYNIDLQKIHIENMQLTVQHVTTNDDKCGSLEKFGLLNLQQSLTMETTLKKYLDRFNIHFDISNKWIFCNGTKIDIPYKSNDINHPSDSQKHRICRVAHKIYYDYQISGFFSMENETDYGGRVHERPEFLHNLKELFKSSLIEDTWKKSVKPYLITFKASLDSFAWFSFYGEKYEYEDDYLRKEEQIKWLIKKALCVIWDMSYYDSSPEIFAYMKPEVIIPPSDFLNIKPISL